jgi:hypothetical protein
MTAGQSGSSSTSGAGLSGLQRVSKDSIEGQLTAKSLIGKDVYDNQGEKLGEVEDVVLDASGAPQLATAFTSRQGGSGSAMGSSTSSTTGRQGSTTPGATGSTYAGTSNDRSATSGSGASTGRGASSTGAGSGASTAVTGAANAMNDLASSMHASMGGAAAIISAGGLFSRDDLVRVPLSQLSYDSSNDRISLNVSRDQFSSLTESDSTRNAAE